MIVTPSSYLLSLHPLVNETSKKEINDLINDIEKENKNKQENDMSLIYKNKKLANKTIGILKKISKKKESVILREMVENFHKAFHPSIKRSIAWFCMEENYKKGIWNFPLKLNQARMAAIADGSKIDRVALSINSDDYERLASTPETIDFFAEQIKNKLKNHQKIEVIEFGSRGYLPTLVVLSHLYDKQEISLHLVDPTLANKSIVMDGQQNIKSFSGNSLGQRLAKIACYRMAENNTSHLFTHNSKEALIERLQAENSKTQPTATILYTIDPPEATEKQIDPVADFKQLSEELQKASRSRNLSVFILNEIANIRGEIKTNFTIEDLRNYFSHDIEKEMVNEKATVPDRASNRRV